MNTGGPDACKGERRQHTGTREERGEGDKETNMDEKERGDRWAKEVEEEHQGNKGTVKGNYYLPADPRLVEVHDGGTVVQSTGRIVPHQTHPQ
jgi:hypothetical protein